jgi:hypothetical protein
MESTEKQAKACLAAHRRGRLLARHAGSIETRAEDIRFVLDGRGGAMVFPLSRPMLELDEFVVFVPDESPDDGGDRLELQVELLTDDAVDEVLRDRHFAYHDRDRGGVWVRAQILAGRFGSAIIDGGALAPTNLLAPIESGLCRACNADKPRLAAACFAHRRVRATEVTAVGVDNFGVDVRIALGVLRLEFDAPVHDDPTARAAIARLLEVSP